MARITQRGSGNFPGDSDSGLVLPMPSKLWTPGQTTAVAANYSRSYERAPEKAHALGGQFYPNWQEDAAHIGQVSGQGLGGGAAIMAHLSPSTEAETNRIMALQLVHGTDDKQIAHIAKSAEHAEIAKAAVGRRTGAQRSGDTAAVERENAIIQKHGALSAKSRSKAGLTGTPLSKQSSSAIMKAANVMRGEYEGDPLATLGSRKIRDFGHLIHDPTGYGRAPIDTHYHDAGLDRADIPYEAERGLSAAGRYESFQNAHAMARNEFGDISHGAFMGAIWYHHQMRKAIENPSSLRSRKAAETQLANYQSNPRLSHFMPTTHGLLPSLGKIPTGR